MVFRLNNGSKTFDWLTNPPGTAYKEAPLRINCILRPQLNCYFSASNKHNLQSVLNWP